MTKISGFPQLLVCGRTHDYDYVIMEFIGQNLSKIRRSSPEKRLIFYK